MKQSLFFVLLLINILLTACDTKDQCLDKGQRYNPETQLCEQ